MMMYFSRTSISCFANHGIGDTQEPVGKGVRLDLGENVALRIQQQRNDAVSAGHDRCPLLNAILTNNIKDLPPDTASFRCC